MPRPEFSKLEPAGAARANRAGLNTPQTPGANPGPATDNERESEMSILQRAIEDMFHDVDAELHALHQIMQSGVWHGNATACMRLDIREEELCRAYIRLERGRYTV